VVRCLGLDRLGFFPMFRDCSGVVALAVMVVGLPTAQAADTTLTLACQGTVTETMVGEEKKPEPTSMGIILNFTSRTVKGFGTPVKITAWDDSFVEFSEDNKSGAFIGNIDRITGTLEASHFHRTSGGITTTSYALKCRPAQRMF
jgi:hypothetical protein